jgi:hypothetical protein
MLRLRPRGSWHVLDGLAPEPGQALSSRTHSGDSGGNVRSNDEPECNQQPHVEKWVF